MKTIAMRVHKILKAVCGFVLVVAFAATALSPLLALFVAGIIFPFMVFFLTSADRLTGQEKNTLAEILEIAGVTEELVASW